MAVTINPLTGGLELGLTDTSTVTVQSSTISSTITDWVRPSEWPALPDITASDEKFVGVLGVFDNDSNYLALSAAGNYTVDWGDGTVENINSGVTAQHQYTYSNGTLTSTSYGYKCAVVVITPQAGQQLTTFNLQYRHSGLTNAQVATTNWLDIALSLPNCGASGLTLNQSVNVVGFRNLQRAQILNTGSCTSYSYLLRSCYGLRSVSFGSTAAVTTMSYMFNACYSLQTVPLFNTAAVWNMSYMFNGCYSLQTVPLFNTAAVTSMNNMFYYCYSLQTVPLFNTAAVTNMSSMFYGCSSLQTVPLFNTAAVTNMSSMFYNCYSLQTVPLFNTAAVKDMSIMFNGCYSLQAVPLFNTAAVTNISAMFNSCYSLQTVPLFNTAAVKDMSSMFYSCYSLQTVPLFNTAAVTYMNSMFYNCYSLQTVPLFNTAAVTNMYQMFYSCYSLQTVPLFNTAAVTNMSAMFYYCYSLQNIPALVQSAITTGNGANFAYGAYSLASAACTGIKYSVDYTRTALSKTGLETVFTNLGKAADTSQVVTITTALGADTAVSKSSCTTTAGSTTVTLADTSNLTTGMICTGTGISTGVAVTFQDSGDTVTYTSHGLANGTMISFSAITSTTGISTYTNYWVINSTANTFQVAATQGGNALALTTNGSGTLLYPAYVTTINPNVSVTLSAPASANGTVTLSFRKLDTFKATSKGWSITG